MTKVWKIDERNAPSSRAYVGVMREWVRRDQQWAYGLLKRTLDEKGYDAGYEDLRSSLMVKLSLESSLRPEAPGPRQVSALGEPAVKKAVTNEVRDLVANGFPLKQLQRLTPFRLPDDKTVSAINLLESGIGKQELEVWASEGTYYINSLKRDYLPRLQDKIINTVVEGRSWKTLAQAIRDASDVQRAQAELIAQDQIAKINGKITQSLQQKAGVTEFIWWATMDERTRATHKAAHGNTYSWATGAPNVGFYKESGFPGQCGRCRCRPKPVPPSWWTDEDDDG